MSDSLTGPDLVGVLVGVRLTTFLGVTCLGAIVKENSRYVLNMRCVEGCV